MNRALFSCLFLLLNLIPSLSTAQWVTTPTGTTDNFFNLYAVTDQVVFGFGTTVVKSTDGGFSWSNLNINTVSSWIQTGHFIDGQTGWVGGKYGVVGGEILKTTDGGASWVSQDTVVDIGINDIFFLNSQIGWAASFSGKILFTSDGGSNWNQIRDLGEEIEHIQFVDASVGWAISYGGTLYKSTNGGQNWTVNTSGKGYGLHFIDSNEGWLTGKDGEVYHTTDGGNNWLQQNTNYNKPLTNIFFADQLHGWAVGGVDCRFNGCVPFQKVIATSDGGLSWTAQTTNGDTIPQFNDISFGSSKAFLAGNDGQIFRLTSTITGKEDLDSELSLLVYPNPAQEKTRIRIPQALQGGSIRISNALGKVVVAQPVSSPLVEIGLENLSPGIYNVVLQQGKTQISELLVKQ